MLLRVALDISKLVRLCCSCLGVLRGVGKALRCESAYTRFVRVTWALIYTSLSLGNLHAAFATLSPSSILTEARILAAT